MLTSAIIEFLAGSCYTQTEAIDVVFALLEDQLMENQQHHRFLLESFECVYKFIQHTNLSRLLLRSLIYSAYKII